MTQPARPNPLRDDPDRPKGLRVNQEGYVVRRMGHQGQKVTRRQPYRVRFLDWWVAKPRLTLATITIPERYHGKRIKFHIIEDPYATDE